MRLVKNGVLGVDEIHTPETMSTRAAGERVPAVGRVLYRTTKETAEASARLHAFVQTLTAADPCRVHAVAATRDAERVVAPFVMGAIENQVAVAVVCSAVHVVAVLVECDPTRRPGNGEKQLFELSEER